MAEVFLLIRSGDGRYALPLDAVREVLPMMQLTRPVGLPALVEGFLNLRGRVVAAVRLAALFGEPAKPLGLYTPIVVLRRPAEAPALIVDAVEGLVTIRADELHPVGPAETLNGCVEAQAAVKGASVHVVSPERLLLEKERRCLNDLRTMEQERLDRLRVAPA